MIAEPISGNLTLKSGTIVGKTLTRSAFLQSREGLEATVLVKNEPWCSFRFLVPEESVVFAVFFKGEVLESLHLAVSDPKSEGSTWDNWSEENEMKRKEANDQWLLQKGLVPGQHYAWGSVWSGYDPKGGSSSAVLTYNGS